MRQSLDSEDYFTATGFPVRSTVLVRMIEGRSRVRACSVLAVHNSTSASVQLFAVQSEIDTFCCTILLLTS